MPAVADVNIAEAKKTFDLNVWSYVAVTQAFLPLLLKSSKGMIVNQTSVGGTCTIPFQAIHNASKSAFFMISNPLRLELQPFSIKIIDLRTAIVKTNLINKPQNRFLPPGSIYAPAKKTVKKSLSQEQFETRRIKRRYGIYRGRIRHRLFRGESQPGRPSLELFYPLGHWTASSRKLRDGSGGAEGVNFSTCCAAGWLFLKCFEMWMGCCGLIGGGIYAG